MMPLSRPLPARTFLVAALTVLAAMAPAVPAGARRASAPSWLAQVRFIERGLGVGPPTGALHAGKVNDSLYNAYRLRTQRLARASIRFKDGTVVHLNQDTDAQITSHLTRVTRGEIAEYLAPGTDHRVQTATAVASATGTTFDVRSNGATSIFVVLHGALQVSNAKGQVLVTTNRQTIVRAGQAPLPPAKVDAKAVFAWTDGIPTPDLGQDVSLNANGGVIAGFSSQRNGPNGAGNVEQIHDGLLSTGWESAMGQVANQWVKVGFAGGNAYRISSVIIDPAATAGSPSSEDLKGFEIRVSTTDTADSSFITVLRGRAARRATLQKFTFPVPVRARYVELVALSNYGSPDRVAVAEWEVVATTSLFARPYGLATDAAGNIYVADAFADRVEKLSPTGTLIAKWGTKGPGPGQFNHPMAVAVDAGGAMYVADTDNSRVVKLSPTGRYITSWGGIGPNDGQFFFPRGIAVDTSGHVYVTDFSGRIEKFTTSGTFLASWSTFGSAGTLQYPEGIAVGPDGNLYIADTYNDRLVIISPDGSLLVTFGTTGTTLGRFSKPTALTFDSKGILYVVDSENDRVQAIDALNQKISAFGTQGSGPGAFILPGGIAATSRGEIVVSDTGNSRLERFTPAGTFKAALGKPATVANILDSPQGVAVDRRGDVYITDQNNDRVQVRAPSGRVLAILGHHGWAAFQKGNTLGQFYYPHGIAIGPDGGIYVADTFNNRIQELAPRGPVRSIGGDATGDRRLYFPYGVAVDRQGTIYVADTANNRVVIYGKNGSWLRAFGGKGSDPGQFSRPSGIAVDSRGNIYVADTSNNRLQKFSPDGKVLWVLGGGSAGIFGRFGAPQTVAVDRRDNVYVTDAPHGDVQKLSPDGTLLRVFVLPGPSANATGVAVARNGTVYVSDQAGNRVFVFAPTGELLDIWT